MNSNTVHLNIEVSGRVQGIGFRYAAVQAAHIHQIKGFVKNLINGSVYIEAEGESQKLHDFTKWCAHGPTHAMVENIKITKGKIKNFQVFEVKY